MNASTLVIVLLIALVLRLSWLVTKQAEAIRLTAAWNTSLKDRCAALEQRIAAPELSDLADNEAAIAFAIDCGYIATAAELNATPDRERRSRIRKSAREYYGDHVAGAVAAANH